MQLDNSVFLVTGGGSGLGAATARALTAGGAAVVLADINADAGTSLAGELGDRVQFVETDVTDEGSAGGAVEFATATFDRLHGLVNCAGIAPAARVVGRDGLHPLDLFSRAVAVNLIGTFNMIRLAGAAMIDNEPGAGGERGVIINTASVAAFDGQIGQAAYSASKGGVVSMTLPIARELAQHGIRVATIAPGIFDTPMMAGLSEKARESLGNQAPFPRRLGRPDEYAALALHIVGNEMINGEVIRLDGAIRMAPR